MNAQYEDYYSQYIDIHRKADIAYEIAVDESVYYSLSGTLSYIKEIMSNSKIIGDNDNIINGYNNSIDNIISRLNSLDDFVNDYRGVEEMYFFLKIQLDALYKQDQNLKAEINNKPKEYKYKIQLEDGEEIDTIKYNMAVKAWEKNIINIKTYAKNLSENISEIINYLSSVNAFDPKLGSFNTIAKPVLYSYDTICNSNMEYWQSNSIDGYYLEGDELKQFIETNYIQNADSTKILKRIIMINDVPVNTYTIYNTNANDVDTKRFNAKIYRCFDAEERIDSTILDRVFNGDNCSNLIFIQSYEQVNERNIPTYDNMIVLGYYMCNTKNITMLLCAEEETAPILTLSGDGVGDNNSNMIIHETGHAYDHYLSSHYNLDENRFYSAQKLYNIVNEEAIYFDESHKEYFEDIDLPPAYFPPGTDYEIRQENGQNNLYVNQQNPLDPSGITINGQSPSAYNLINYTEKPYEYFADAFYAYWVGDYFDRENGGISKLEYLCPQTYNALYNLFNEEINGGN